MEFFFDGEYSKEGDRDSLVLISPTKKETHLSYKPEFEATNNVVEYESLILGLEATRKMQITKLVVFEDSELVVYQVKGSYHKIHPRMRAYINMAWDMIDNFDEDFNISFFLREFNHLVDSLAIVSNTFKVPSTPQVKYEIDLRCRPSIPDNAKYWQVFKDEEQIKIFMEVIDEFENTHMDSNDEGDTKQEIGEEDEKIPNFSNYMVEHKVLHLKNNFIPKGLVPLE
jgi:ribonuclease HI